MMISELVRGPGRIAVVLMTFFLRLITEPETVPWYAAWIMGSFHSLRTKCESNDHENASGTGQNRCPGVSNSFDYLIRIYATQLRRRQMNTVPASARGW